MALEMGKESLEPYEIRPKSISGSRRLLKDVQKWFKLASGSEDYWYSQAGKQALIDKTRGLILQNPRPKDLMRVKRSAKR